MSAAQDSTTPTLRSQQEFFITGMVPVAAAPDTDCSICTEGLTKDVVQILTYVGSGSNVSDLRDYFRNLIASQCSLPGLTVTDDFMLEEFANGEEPRFSSILKQLRYKTKLEDHEAEWWKNYLHSVFAACVGHTRGLNRLETAEIREEALRTHDVQCTTDPYPADNNNVPQCPIARPLEATFWSWANRRHEVTWGYHRKMQRELAVNQLAAILGIGLGFVRRIGDVSRHSGLSAHIIRMCLIQYDTCLIRFERELQEWYRHEEEEHGEEYAKRLVDMARSRAVEAQQYNGVVRGMDVLTEGWY
ncbi:hypothetical protein BDU57DRAFT_572557 [Ampelomyces quisqualis]|uniref:Uncharacterized protein n=1 Tax=Ampelomyces quisqualis TaxID=50730 RepID=A0A6A5QRJ0_AMPQU|nr:hypothetical protein BDU57DRAFT_572557 [Ampelomyces quisqualis]